MYIKKMVGTKCYLSIMNIDDAEQFTVWLNDMELTNYLRFSSSVITVESEKEILKTLSQENTYSIIDMETDKLIGSVGLERIDHLNQSAEIGIFIGDRDYWNKGFGQEALSLLINYAYKRLNLHNIYLNAYSFNLRAISCYKKIGFSIIGERREILLRDGKYHNIVLMDLLPSDFYNKNTKYVNHNK